MNEQPSASGATGVDAPALRQARDWIACGRRLVLGHKSLWFGMSALYLVLGFVLKRIPFLGDLLLILVTPMLLAGVVWGLAQEQEAEPTAAAAPGSAAALFQAWVSRPAQQLLRIFGQEGKLFGAVLLGIVTLGLVIAVKIVGYLLIGGSMISGLSAGQAVGAQLATLAGMALVAVLSVLLGMGLLYSVPLTVLGGRQPLDAVAESFARCRARAGPLLALVAPFFLVYVIVLAAFAGSHWLGYLLTVSLGLPALPLFVATVYCSYLALFPRHPADGRR